MKFINKIFFVIKESMSGIFKNFYKSFIQFLVCFISLTFFSVVFSVYFNAQNMASNMRDKIEISVFLKDDITSSQLFDIENKIKNDTNVKKYSYISKEEAQEKGKKMFDNSPEMLEAIKSLNNPFPASFIIDLKNADTTASTAKSFMSLSGVEENGVKYGEEYMNKLLYISNGLKYGSYIALGFFFFVAVFFMISIVNVIISTKEQECQIMFMIGASPFQIKLPFYIEGALMGLISSALSYFTFYYAYQTLSNNFSFIFTNINNFSLSLMKIILSTGFVTGIIATKVALRQFNKVSKKVIKKRKFKEHKVNDLKKAKICS